MRNIRNVFAQSNAAKIPLPFKAFLRIFFRTRSAAHASHSKHKHDDSAFALHTTNAFHTRSLAAHFSLFQIALTDYE